MVSGFVVLVARRLMAGIMLTSEVRDMISFRITGVAGQGSVRGLHQFDWCCTFSVSLFGLALSRLEDRPD